TLADATVLANPQRIPNELRPALPVHVGQERPNHGIQDAPYRNLLTLAHTAVFANPQSIPNEPCPALPVHVGQERPNHEMPDAMNRNIRVNRHIRNQRYAKQLSIVLLDLARF
ncbi:hypothetical protein J6590_059708, partial [Homalodisca vitripennis]